MKKTLAILLAALMILSLAACGGDKKSDAPAGDAAAFTPVDGESYDTGKFTVTVPKGWLTVPASDLFDEYDGDFDPTTITLIKDGKEEWDALDHAWLKINLYDKGELMSSKDWYDDVKDLDAVNVSGFDCTGFTGSSGDYPYAILEGANAANDISFSLLLKNDVNSMDLGDADVQTILRSVVVK